MRKINNNNNMIKYIIILGIIYSLLKLVPEQKIEDRDLMLIIVVIIFVFYVVEMLCHKSKIYLQQNTNIQDDAEEFVDVPDAAKDATKDVAKDAAKDVVKDHVVAVKEVGVEQAQKLKQLQQQVQQLLDAQSDSKSGTKQDTTIAMKYLNSLVQDLVKMDILTHEDIKIIKMKIENKLLDIEEILPRLEKMKENGINKHVKKVTNDNIYNELEYDSTKPIGSDIANNWSEKLGDKLGYTILNTDKWQVPKPRVPNCKPCQTLCPSTYNNFTDLSEWDNSLKLTDNVVNQAWAKDQVPKKS